MTNRRRLHFTPLTLGVAVVAGLWFFWDLETSALLALAGQSLLLIVGIIFLACVFFVLFVVGRALWRQRQRKTFSKGPPL